MRYFILLLLASSVAACDMDPRPPSYLDDLRILAVEATPLEAGPDDVVTLEPVIFVPEGETLTELSWSFCPFTLGSRAAFECAMPACEVPLEPDERGGVTARPLELASACPLAAAGLPDSFESLFRLVVRTDTGAERVGLTRIQIWTAAPPPERNGLPAVSGVEVDGVRVEPGDMLPPVSEDDRLEVRVILDAAALDAFVDNAGRERIEEPLVSLYSTAGRFERDRDIGDDVTIPWSATRLEEGQDGADLYAVVRDLRGGQIVWGPITVPIER